MLIGYASTRPHHGPTADEQRVGLLGRGCCVVFDDDKRASPAHRPGLIEAVYNCCTGDALMIWHARTLGDSLDDIAWVIGALGKRQIGLAMAGAWFFDLSPAPPKFRNLVGLLLRHGEAVVQATRDGLI